jgi:integrase
MGFRWCFDFSDLFSVFQFVNKKRVQKLQSCTLLYTFEEVNSKLEIMASLKWFIRTTAKTKSKPVTIRVRLRDGQKDVYSKTHLSISAKFWNQKARTTRAKISNSGDFAERDWYKDQLEALERHILKSYQDGGELSKEWFSECIERFRNPESFEKKPVTLFEYISHFIEQSEQSINPKTGSPVHYRIRRDYIRTFDLLKEFAGGREIDFKDIDLDFYNDWIGFLQTKSIGSTEEPKYYKANTVGKFVKNLKVFLNKATEDGINTNLRYKSHRFVKIQVETDSIYLNEAELSRIQQIDLSNRPYLERVRDLFLVGNWTGLRFGDLSRVRPENIQGGFIRVTQSKTGDRVVIPLHPVVTSILEKYEGQLPPAISNQKTNDFLKEIAKLAELNEDIHISETRGGIKRTVKRQKWELVSSHTARRSFATNLYKSGFPSQSIMKITGHKSESAFLRYLKVSEEEHANLLLQHWTKNSNHLKVVG